MIRKSFILGLLVLGGTLNSCKDVKAPEEINTAPIEFKKEGEILLVRPGGDTLKRLDIEIADDDYQRETGLMYRKEMKEDRGMLFIFKDEAPRGFYMKNTHIPLDLIFIDSQNKIVHISPDAAPNSLETIPSNAPAQYVLEVNAGLAEKWNLQVGDSLILKK